MFQRLGAPDRVVLVKVPFIDSLALVRKKTGLLSKINRREVVIHTVDLVKRYGLELLLSKLFGPFVLGHKKLILNLRDNRRLVPELTVSSVIEILQCRS